MLQKSHLDSNHQHILSLISLALALDSLEGHAAEETRNRDVLAESIRKRDLRLSLQLTVARSGELGSHKWVSTRQQSSRYDELTRSLGDLLVSTGDDGLVQVWKKANNDQWMQYAEVDAIGDN